MTETIKFVDGISYTEADQSEWNMRVERPQGIFLDSGLGVLGSTAPGGMLVRVTPGHAMVRGFLYANDANKDVVIAANASGSARIDTVVLRLVPTSNICTALVVQGTPGAGAPSLIQVVGGTWDFPLCDVAVANGAASILAGSLADRRVYSYWPASAIDPTMATDAEVSAAVASEASLRASADTTLTTNLNTEISTRTTQFNTQATANTGLQNQINSEVTNRTTADSNEVTNRTNADNAHANGTTGHLRAWAVISNGVSPTIIRTYGVGSITRTAIGGYFVSMTVGMSSNAYCVVGNANLGVLVNIGTKNSSQFNIYTWASSSGGAQDFSELEFMVIDA